MKKRINNSTGYLAKLGLSKNVYFQLSTNLSVYSDRQPVS
jgi:hypothetical protein